MNLKKCSSCGLAVIDSLKLVECFKFGKKIFEQDTEEESCVYYMEIKYEDGDAMTPLQHFLLKEQELKARKMKGVV